jgi:predicted TIM-barrel fold metal-dependent hydrolase
MTEIIYAPDEESGFPHGADVHEREVAENGFAAGWCMQAKPVADYWFDFHIHGEIKPGSDMMSEIQYDLDLNREFNVRRGMVIIGICGPRWPRERSTHQGMDKHPYLTSDEAAAVTKSANEDGGAAWAAYLKYLNPDPELIKSVRSAGARCIKLHNAPQIEDAAPADLWLSPDWQAAFAAMAGCSLPVLWHVTQRLPACPYTGGGRNSYWAKGWENGVKYGNEELLQVFLKCCERNPGVNFVGAHQLHIGWERLDALFAGYPNLYVDTTIGCVLQEDDTFYPKDKEFLRAVFIKWADRIIYGTDSVWGSRNNRSTQSKHIRFLKHLDLPSDMLNKIAHGNAERLLGLGPVK